MDTVTGKRSLLIIEDNEINREMLKVLLGDEYYLYEAENGKKGIEVLQQQYQKISLVLLDVQMPVMDGFAVLKYVKADPLLKNIPIVVATGFAAEDVEEKCLNLGATDFVTKPYKPNIVRSRVKNIIRLRESAAEISAIEYDELTGVYTRQAFYHHAARLLKENPDRHYSLIMSDIDDFKVINEKYGEEYADQLLLHGVSFIKPAMEQGVPVGRYGSDRFVTLVELDEQKNNTDFMLSMINSIKQSFPVPGLEMRMGVYEDVDHDLPVSVLCDKALLAVRSITHQFGKYVAFYDDSLRKRVELEQRLELDMKRAYYEDEFCVYYQPKHDTRTGKLVGAEALIRWQHPDLGFLPPSDFIPLLEKNGFIVYADYFVWKKTCEYLREWIGKGIPVVPVSVNTSRRDYEYPNYLDMVMGPVKRFDIDPSLLHLEVTESLFSDRLEEMTGLLKACRDKGFRVELDDFGSGYSSLNILGSLPLDTVKLDMSFMRQLQNEKKARVFSSCITLAQTLGLTTIAEGVETKEQRSLLKSLRCDEIQGYYFSKPLPKKEFEQYMIDCAQKQNLTESTPEEAGSEAALYVVDEDYRVVLINDMAKQLYPQMRVGEKCYHCLMGLDAPCDICPVKNKVRGPQNYLDPLRGVYETVQVARVPLEEGKTGYALVLYTLQ